MMNTILICNLLFLLTLTSVKAEVTFASLYNGFMKLEHNQEEDCLKENNLSEAMVETMLDNIAKTGVFPDQREYQCFLTCMLLKSDCINEKGELKLDKIQEITKVIHSTILNKSLQECTNKITTKDSCEKGALIEQCFSDQVKVMLSKKVNN